MEMELKQHLFHIIEAPELVTLQDAIQPLFTFLDTKTSPYKESLIRQNFTRLFILIFIQLKNLFFDCI